MDAIEISVTPPESLVKFEAPLFVGIESRQHASPTRNENASKLDDMINSMLPPREWTEESGVWIQNVSKEPASRLDVIALQEQLDGKLNERKARETGICPVREELYAQCFNELIRHVSIDSPERGLLLLRTRDELRMTIDAYKMLYASSVTFGIKKQLSAEQGLPELQEESEVLEGQKAKLELEVQELRSKLEIVNKREQERKEADEKRRKEELDFLRYQGQHLDTFWKQMNNGK